MQHSNDISVLMAQLHTFQKRIAPLKKSATATKNGETFTYAPVDDILKHIRLPLARLGLFIVQTVTGDIGVTTHLWHVSDQWIADTAMELTAQTREDKAAAITQLRRYSLITLLGLPTVEPEAKQLTPQAIIDENRQRYMGVCPYCKVGKLQPGLIDRGDPFCPNCKRSLMQMNTEVFNRVLERQLS